MDQLTREIYAAIVVVTYGVIVGTAVLAIAGLVFIWRFVTTRMELHIVGKILLLIFLLFCLVIIFNLCSMALYG